MATMSRERRGSRRRGGRREGLSANPVEGLRNIAAADWDALVQPGSGPLEHGYLTAWEKVELQGLTSRPVVAHAPGSDKPVAACPGYLYDLDIPTVRSPKVSPVVHAIRRVWRGFLYARTYELGSPTPLTNPFLVPDLERRPEAVRSLIGTAVEEGRRCDADFVLVQNFISREGPAAEELKSLGFAAVPMLPTGVVDLPFDSFDDYLGAMRSQYRRRAKQAFKRSKELTAEHLSDFASTPASSRASGV
jgi:predicted N-acyltransferase